MGDTSPRATGTSLPMYEFTADLATLQPPPPELGRVLAAAAGNQEAMDGFARAAAGVISPADYFSEGERRPHLRHGPVLRSAPGGA